MLDFYPQRVTLQLALPHFDSNLKLNNCTAKSEALEYKLKTPNPLVPSNNAIALVLMIEKIIVIIFTPTPTTPDVFNISLYEAILS